MLNQVSIQFTNWESHTIFLFRVQIITQKHHLNLFTQTFGDLHQLLSKRDIGTIYIIQMISQSSLRYTFCLKWQAKTVILKFQAFAKRNFDQKIKILQTDLVENMGLFNLFLNKLGSILGILFLTLVHKMEELIENIYIL